MLSERQIRNSKNELLKLKRVATKMQKRCKKGGKQWNKHEREISSASSQIKIIRTIINGNCIDYKTLKTKKQVKTFVLKMNQIRSLVLETLKHDMPSRDDDNILCIKVWEKQGSKPNMTYNGFKSKLLVGKFSSPESISRCRRSLQERYKTLRGELYEKRHQAEEKFRSQYRMEFE